MKSLLMGLEVISETLKISEFITCVMVAQEKKNVQNISHVILLKPDKTEA